MCQSPSQTNVPSTDATDQHRQAGFQRRCTINVERFTELRSPKWQLGHLQLKTKKMLSYRKETALQGAL